MVSRSKDKPAASSKSSSDDRGAALQPYTVLARRYRSRDFDEIVGQEPIARTLQNAIKTNRTAHAYLFSGTRGVGKTSMARIFAKALNATDNLKEKEQIGQAILRGDDLDVIEIDAASNRGIDNARDLIANAGLHPARSPYKVYIIDEVHMLTREAFNALLKTMEEPPAHVKFILCTTEPHKVPATIQSRCQRFDFRTISTSKIAEQLKLILKGEGISAPDEVIAQVARLGNGSMRDALSLLDRLLAGGERTLTNELLEQMLGLPDHTLITGLLDGIIASDPRAALEAGAQLLAGGATIEQALELISDHLRNLMLIAACGQDCEIVDLSEESRQIAAGQAAHFDAPALVHMIAICAAVAHSVRTSAAARALFDAAIVRMAMSRHFADITGLLSGKTPPLGGGSEPKSAAIADSKKKGPLIAADSSRSGPLRAEITTSEDALIGAAPELGASVTAHGNITEIKHDGDDQLWSRVLEVAAASMGDRMRTEHLVFESFDGRTLRLSIDESGADIARYLSREVDRLTDLVKRATGRIVRIELDMSRFEGRGKAQPETGGSSQPPPAIVAQALELFDAAIVSVDAIEPTSGNPP